MNDVANDPIARVAQRWAAPESVDTLASTVRTAAFVATNVVEGSEYRANPALYVIEAREINLTGKYRADFVSDINRAVAEWFREVADEMDPRRDTEWTTVKETDPPERVPCLVLDDAGDVGVGFWEARTGWHGTDDGMSYDAITHWARVQMPDDLDNEKART